MVQSIQVCYSVKLLEESAENHEWMAERCKAWQAKLHRASAVAPILQLLYSLPILQSSDIEVFIIVKPGIMRLSL